MTENLERTNEEQTEVTSINPQLMRDFIIETAQEVQDIRLLKVLYIRAKTLRNM